jgi:MSHA pilin protein MshC
VLRVLKALVRTRARLRRIGADAGFTLMELLTVIVLIGIVSAITIPFLRHYQSSQQLVSSTRDVVSLMRHAQGTAVSKSTTARIDIAADKKSVTEWVADSAGTYTKVGTVSLTNGISVASYTFTARAGGTSTSAYFYSRGTATTGTVVLERTSGARHTITIEGVTGRVSYA